MLTYDALVALEKESFFGKKLMRWSSFSCSGWVLLQRLLGDATALLHTTLDWHLLEVIVSSWEPLPFSSYPSAYHLCSISAATLLQEAC